MVILDRVFCDFCHSVIGQLFSCNAQAPDLIDDHGISPHYCVCPDCTLPGQIYTSTLVVDHLEHF